MSENKVKRKRMSVNEYRHEMINKVFGWLTVIDVYKDEISGRAMCKCQCKCGSIKCVEAKRIISNRLFSCGCYKHSSQFKQHISNWSKNNPDKVIGKSNKCADWFKNNPDKVLLRSIKYSDWCKNNQDAFNSKTINIVNAKKSKRIINLAEFDKDTLSNIHCDDLNELLNGDLKGKDTIRIKCPSCGNYGRHRIDNSISLKSKTLTLRLCKQCADKLTASHYEQEIADYISTFYNGAIIRNSREVIAPLELDLYYPEKQIAIEFNGDYWHDENHKQKDYHLNKYLQCKEKGILLVSIFESEWLSKKEEIKSYLHDLFNHIDNDLSFISDGSKMNNNYPAPSCMSKLLKTEESYYTANESKVFTCGYTKLK